jgi:hypothetical protein
MTKELQECLEDMSNLDLPITVITPDDNTKYAVSGFYVELDKNANPIELVIQIA